MRSGALGLHKVYALQVRMPIVPCTDSIGFHDRLLGASLCDWHPLYLLYYLSLIEVRDPVAAVLHHDSYRRITACF